jgi:hypothetical protein
VGIDALVATAASPEAERPLSAHLRSVVLINVSTKKLRLLFTSLAIAIGVVAVAPGASST